MRVLFLIDSNIAITSDPLSHTLEPGADVAMQFLRMVSTYHHDIRTHPASRMDFDRIDDPQRKRARLALFERYEPLVGAPPISEAQRAELGIAPSGSNDDVDDRLLAAVVGDAVGYLVTNDGGIHRKARRLGVADRVLTLADTVALLHTLHAELPSTPPSVRRVKTHELNIQDPIFDGLKDDYDGFVDWFTRASRAQRDAFLIDGIEEHAAIAIIKKEPAGEFGLPGPQLKLCTFKVASGYSGQKYGELLLKAAFDQAHAEKDAGVYVTVFAKQAALIALLNDFGFERLADVVTPIGEWVYAKPLVGTPSPGMSALDQNIRYGPPWLCWTGTTPFIVPIEPRWHRMLFPDAEPEDGVLFSAIGLSPQPFGNALRKAYLCNAPTRLLEAGDPLLFYRSSDEKAVFVVGVCERTLVSRDPAEIAATVGRRTVYSLDEIETLTRRGEVLVVMFRQDRILRDDPVTLGELISAKAVTSWPQAISRIRPEGVAWLASRTAV